MSQFNIGRIYRYTNDGASVDMKAFNVLDYPDLPYKAHASSLDYSPVADRLYWAWMQPNLEPRGSAISEHDPVTLEMTRSWDTSALTDYMDALAIDPATGDLWYSSGLDLVRVPYSSVSGFDFSAVAIYGLKPYSSSRASEGSPPLLGLFSGLRIRGRLIYAFTHTSEASVRGLGPRTNNGLVVYDMASLSNSDPLANDYLRFYNYSYPEEAPDQEGGDIVAGHAIVTSADERIWLLELLQE